MAIGGKYCTEEGWHERDPGLVGTTIGYSDAIKIDDRWLSTVEGRLVEAVVDAAALFERLYQINARIYGPVPSGCTAANVDNPDAIKDRIDYQMNELSDKFADIGVQIARLEEL